MFVVFQGELLFDEVFEYLVIMLVLEDGMIKNCGCCFVVKVFLEDCGSELLGLLLFFEVEGYFCVCRVVCKKFINFCYQVCIYISYFDVFN